MFIFICLLRQKNHCKDTLGINNSDDIISWRENRNQIDGEQEWEVNFTIKYFKLLKIIKINIYLKLNE